ncbi:BZ3500_MvSof-1268-A1-R1_Chr3-3g06603 [Microbotryum saponariae]|uniref:BZ3500_MvSof-1268-A1-R1_Chr3-3g06603 protein n=1 Tax=Microbotryum saponariae TaxID=289078 RepID=A0A2X0LHC0_9BASI|nr:BZ3500_MvSof-1268-A1-R1_Chr3-3g06603 [Microbotryum saponariae]SDA04570.1 BZ3501_MvSof-1269-A2-R1_Chr3-2g06290 [Microbotryum saponariae]
MYRYFEAVLARILPPLHRKYGRSQLPVKSTAGELPLRRARSSKMLLLQYVMGILPYEVSIEKCAKFGNGSSVSPAAETLEVHMPGGHSNFIPRTLQCDPFEHLYRTVSNFDSAMSYPDCAVRNRRFLFEHGLLPSHFSNGSLMTD